MFCLVHPGNAGRNCHSCIPYAVHQAALRLHRIVSGKTSVGLHVSSSSVQHFLLLTVAIVATPYALSAVQLTHCECPATVPLLQRACITTYHEVSMSGMHDCHLQVLLCLIGVIVIKHTQHVYLQTQQLMLKGLLPSAAVSVDTRHSSTILTLTGTAATTTFLPKSQQQLLLQRPKPRSKIRRIYSAAGYSHKDVLVGIARAGSIACASPLCCISCLAQS